MSLPLTSVVDISQRVEDAKYPDAQGRPQCERLVTLVGAHPRAPDTAASIETVWERWNDPSNNRNHRSSHSTMRVAVYSGPDANVRTLHASFQLDSAQAPTVRKDVLCWAYFAQAPDHAVLCALVQPTAVCIWDVYPTRASSSRLSLPTEGWTVPLPFSCVGLQAVGTAGLLLQRVPDAQDRAQDDDVDDNDDMLLQDGNHAQGFFLQPPRARPHAVSSLFHLPHPMQDLVPVAKLASKLLRPITDVYEQLLWVGPAANYNTTTADHKVDAGHQTLVAVTYHQVHQRHAVWTIDAAPPPPQAPPCLYQRVAVAPERGARAWDLMDLQVADTGAAASDAAVRHAIPHEAALAQALGVRRRATPRHSSVSSRDVLTPSAASLDTSSAVTPTAAATSMLHAAWSDPVGGRLEALLAMTCRYKEKATDRNSGPARTIYRATSADPLATATTTTIAIMVGNAELRLVSLDALYKLSSVHVISCRAAQPVDTTRGAVDSWVLSQSHPPVLQLYRGPTAVTHVTVPLDADDILVDLDQVVQRRGTVEVRSTKTGQQRWLRGSLGLKLCSAAEGPLAAVEAALVKASRRGLQTTDAYNGEACDWNQLALLIRVEAGRLAATMDNWEALETVVSGLADFELGASSSRLPSAVQSEPENAWQALLQSDLGDLSFGLLDDDDDERTGLKAGAASNRSSAPSVVTQFVADKNMPQVFRRIFDALHLCYEDMQLSAMTTGTVSRRLALLLSRQCSKFVEATVDVRLANSFFEYYNTRLVSAKDLVGNTMFVSDDMVEDQGRLTCFSAPPSFLAWMESKMKGTELSNDYFDQCQSKEINSACSRIRSLQRIASLLFTQGNPRRDLEVVTALMEEGFNDLSLVRDSVPAGLAVPIMEVLFRCRSNPSLGELAGWSPEAWTLVGREDLAKNLAEPLMASSADVAEQNDDNDEDKDGLVPLERSSAMLFPDDNRIHEAGRLLRSSHPVFLRVPRAVEVSDHDYERLKQKQLLLLCRRTLALPIGRGMLTIGSLKPVAAEPLPVPELCMKGRVPPQNSILALDISDCPPDLRVWPEFHNGVAAGLRLPLARNKDGTPGFEITRTWIVYNRPPTANETPPEDGQEDPNPALQRKSHSHGGLLLALGLRGHLTVLEMSDLYEYLTQGTVTTTVGVLLGMAANKRGSCDMAVSKMLCLHIPSLIPQHFSAIDVASTVQIAAVTGAGLLFQQSSHRMMTEFLLNEIGKRPESDANACDRESYTLACSLALGMVNLCLGESNSPESNRAAGIADLRIEERLYRYILGGVDSDESRRIRESNDRFSLPSAANGGDNEKCSTVFEGDQVNTDVTAPGATLALGLMYMKTENQTIATVLNLPDTHFLLEFVRPDFLTLRIIARSLIMWNQVKPTTEWIEGQVPTVVRQAYGHMRGVAKYTAEGRSPMPKRADTAYDRHAVRQIYVHVVAGACFGMGLRFAGTADPRAKAALMERVLELYTLREANDAVSVASRPDFPILQTCLSCAALSLAMVMAGSGDLEVLRVFKMLRWRCDHDTKYGYHVAFGMAIGLLFLGGGTCTLGRSASDLAALVTAFLPRFPIRTADNQYHLQATRHLYSLAVHRKHMRAVEVTTGETVSVSLQVEFENKETDNTTLSRTLPCLLHNAESVPRWLRVVSDQYYPVQLDGRVDRNLVYVKRRSGGGGEQLAFGPKSNRADDVAGGTTALYQRFLGRKDHESRLVLQASTAQNETLPLYLSFSSISTWDVRLIRSYYKHRHLWLGTDSDEEQALLSTELILPYLHERIERQVLNSTKTKSVQDLATFFEVEATSSSVK